MQKRAILTSAFFCGALIAMALFLVFDPDDFVALDTAAGNIAHPFQTLFGAELFLIITIFGSTTAAFASVVLAITFLRRECGFCIRYIAALLSSVLLSTLLKNLFERVRPPSIQWVIDLHSYSFPSGHATTATVIFGFLGLIASRRAHGVWRRLILVAAFSAIALVCASRIVLGYHYASDVLAGVLLGGVCVSAAFAYPLSPRERRYLRF